VDVKARKRLARSDDEAQDSWLLLELHGVGANNRGWLYGSQAHLIAQETSDAFLLLSRRGLIEYVERYVDQSSRAKSSKEAQYTVYNRRGADLLTWVKREHLCAHPGVLRACWDKPEPPQVKLANTLRRVIEELQQALAEFQAHPSG